MKKPTKRSTDYQYTLSKWAVVLSFTLLTTTVISLQVLNRYSGNSNTKLSYLPSAALLTISIFGGAANMRSIFYHKNKSGKKFRDFAGTKDGRLFVYQVTALFVSLATLLFIVLGSI